MSGCAKYIAEGIATFCLVFAGTGAIVVNQATEGQISHLGVSLVFGFVVLAMIYTFGHISGAHVNPAVTVAFWSAGRFPRQEVPKYVGAQILGSILASTAIRLLFITDKTTLGVTEPTGAAVQAFFMEFLLTLILMIVVMGVAHDDRAEGIMAGVAIGATICLEAIVGGPISGASMNPARSFGPALVGMRFAHHWIYWAAPVSGAVLGAWIYKFVILSGVVCREESGLPLEKRRGQDPSAPPQDDKTVSDSNERSEHE